MYDSNTSIKQDSSSNSQGIRIQYEEHSVYKPSDDDESFLVQKSCDDIGDDRRIVYRIKMIYKLEEDFRIAHQLKDKENSSSFDNTVQRDNFKIILIKNMRLVYLYLQEIQNKAKMRRVVAIKDIIYRRHNIVMKIERMEYQFFDYIKLNPNAAVIVQLITHFIEGLEELEKHHLYDLDRHKGNFMVKIENGSIVGKHFDFQLSLWLHPKVSSQIRHYNIKILGCKNYQRFYSRFGEQLVQLANSIKDKYDEMIRCKDVLRKIHTIQLFRLIKDVKAEIQPYVIKNSQLKKVVSVLDRYQLLQSRQKLLQNLQNCLLVVNQQIRPIDISDNYSRSQLLSKLKFTRIQLKDFFKKYDFIRDPFDDDKNAQDRYFVGPILNIQNGERTILDDKSTKGIKTIINAIEKHMIEEFDDEPELFRRLVQLLKMQLGQELLGQRSQPQSMFFGPQIHFNNQIIINRAQQHIHIQQSESLCNNSKISCYDSMFEFNPRSQQNFIQATQPIIESVIPPIVNRSQSNGQDEVLRFLGQSQNFQEAKDIELFMNFIAFDPPSLQQLTKHESNKDKFIQLYSYLIKKGFSGTQLRSEIERIDFTGNNYFIKKLSHKIQEKFIQLYEQLIKRGDVIDLVNSKYLEETKDKYLAIAVNHYFNLSYFNFQEQLTNLKKTHKFVLTPEEEKIFFLKVDKLYEHEPCNVFRNFLKQHIIAIFGNAKKFLRKQEGLNPSPLFSPSKNGKQKSQGKGDRISPSSKKENDYDKTTTSSYIGSIKQCTNSHNTHQITTQNFYFGGIKIPNLFQLGLIKMRYRKNQSSDESQDQQFQHYRRREEDSQSDSDQGHQFEPQQVSSSEEEYDYSNDERW